MRVATTFAPGLPPLLYKYRLARADINKRWHTSLLYPYFAVLVKHFYKRRRGAVQPSKIRLFSRYAMLLKYSQAPQPFFPML